ncbi:YtxH domain-containing protein [Agromyces albus]|uniref:YtxH domain-containing protein n=1 Tax=Agromyces albus TaxID=205332 RepID=UPI001F521EA0|nr:YtxH domain-containing protein [Agromyces albus]
MKGKILFVVGLGVGYVLGTRAGRERYEQIRRGAEKIWNTPAVQEGVDTAKEFAASRVGDLSDVVLDNVKSFVRTVTKGESGAKSSASTKPKSSASGKTSSGPTRVGDEPTGGPGSTGEKAQPKTVKPATKPRGSTAASDS